MGGASSGWGAADAPAGSRDLALRKLLRRFTDVCNAIDYAHSYGVIHRRSESDIRLLDYSKIDKAQIVGYSRSSSPTRLLTELDASDA